MDGIGRLSRVQLHRLDGGIDSLFLRVRRMRIGLRKCLMCGCELGVELYRFFQYFPGLASGVSVEAAFLHQEDSVKILRSESSRPQLDFFHHFEAETPLAGVRRDLFPELFQIAKSRARGIQLVA